MYKLKLCVLALVIGLAGIGYASNLTSQNQAAKQDKTDCCAADSQHDSCGTAKNDGDCCKPGAACCDGGSCCSKHNHSKQAQAKRANLRNLPNRLRPRATAALAARAAQAARAVPSTKHTANLPGFIR